MSVDPMRPRPAPKAPEGFYNLDAIRLVGFDAEVQRGGEMGTEKRGLFGFAAVIGPDGKPRVVAQMKHGEGGSLSAIMNEEDFGIFLGIVVETNQAAAQLAAAAPPEDGKPS